LIFAAFEAFWYNLVIGNALIELFHHKIMEFPRQVWGWKIHIWISAYIYDKKKCWWKINTWPINVSILIIHFVHYSCSHTWKFHDFMMEQFNQCVSNYQIVSECFKCCKTFKYLSSKIKPNRCSCPLKNTNG
jgi:hypothetical protein